MDSAAEVPTMICLKFQGESNEKTHIIKLYWSNYAILTSFPFLTVKAHLEQPSDFPDDPQHSTDVVQQTHDESKEEDDRHTL
jgi:hypothetical protein